MLMKDINCGDLHRWVIKILLPQLQMFRSKITSYLIKHNPLIKIQSRNNKIQLRGYGTIDDTKQTF